MSLELQRRKPLRIPRGSETHLKPLPNSSGSCILVKSEGWFWVPFNAFSVLISLHCLLHAPHSTPATQDNSFCVTGFPFL